MLPRLLRRASLVAICLAVGAVHDRVGGQTLPGQLTSRESLIDAAKQAERSGNSMEAAGIRRRLADGDFQVGDRVLLTVRSDVAHTDTLVVREGLVLDLPYSTTVPLAGVLRSELKPRVTSEVLKYVKATDVDVTPLTRIAVLGEVSRPGYFAVRSDIPITDAIMMAGGPTGSADIERSVIKRGNREFRSADETRQAVSQGLTLDQLGLSAGDELVVGRQHPFINPTTTAAVGMAASIAAIFFAIHR
ncbi:MAG TPA: SLBB domain-containing protein [Gemmatimonadaceae bacterium]|jgi:protein involved in polysaccharide export with SLBB domain